MSEPSPKEPFSDDPVLQRRLRLRTFANPDTKTDYLSFHDGTLLQNKIAVSLAYVPDKLLLESHSFAAYLDGLVTPDLRSLEALALVLKEDFNNEVVPRWVQIRLVHRADRTHGVIVVDEQPRWSNPALLSRLSAI